MRRILTVTISVILILFCLTACGNEKMVKTTADFVAIVEEKGFEIEDVTDSANTETVDKIIVAKKDNTYQMEFYDLKKADDAEALFGYIKTALDSEYSVKMLVKSVSSTNYDYYRFESGDTFEIVIRVEDTMLYCGAAKEYKESVDEIIEIMGY